jgi:hypothetical protein
VSGSSGSGVGFVRSVRVEHVVTLSAETLAAIALLRGIIAPSVPRAEARAAFEGAPPPEAGDAKPVMRAERGDPADRDETQARFVALCVSLGIPQMTAEMEAVKLMAKPWRHVRRAVAHAVMRADRIKGSPIGYVHSFAANPDWPVDAACLSPWPEVDRVAASLAAKRGGDHETEEPLPPPKPDKHQEEMDRMWAEIEGKGKKRG